VLLKRKPSDKQFAEPPFTNGRIAKKLPLQVPKEDINDE